jgi:hypothetical protein
MPIKEYRAAFLEGRDFTPMPTPAEQRRQALEREAALQAEAEANLSRRSKLAVPKPAQRRGLSRDEIFKNLRRYLPNV